MRLKKVYNIIIVEENGKAYEILNLISGEMIKNGEMYQNER